ncbi:MAG: methionyl-tRNA formyltransferase [Candidatus Gastranaerophilaceae bacterium]
MKVVILGSGQMLTNLIAGCMDAGCNIVGVFRYERVRYPLIDRLIIDILNPSKEYNYIKGHKLYEIKARSANSAEFKKEILRLNADLILVGTWGEKIKKSIIDLPKFATINVHPALLPKYRGPNPYLQSIKHLEKESGVTFHLMDENFDTGAILLQKIVKIEPADTGKELRDKTATAAREGVCELINNLDTEIIIPIPQDEKHSSYFPQITENDVMLDFSKSAEEVSAHIRGFHPWYKCYFAYNKQFFTPNPYELEIISKSSHVSHLTSHSAIVAKSAKDNSITVLCGDGKLLKMNDVRLYGFLNRFFTKFYIRHIVKNSSKVC